MMSMLLRIDTKNMNLSSARYAISYCLCSFLFLFYLNIASDCLIEFIKNPHVDQMQQLFENVSIVCK